MKTITIPGPLGPFLIPAEPAATREVCERLSRAVFEGEYDVACDDVPPRPVVLDIGAGWGAFGCWARAKWPECRLRAYEPHEAAARLYVVNLGVFTEYEKWGRLSVAHDGLKTSLYVSAVSTDLNPLYSVGDNWGEGHTHGATSGIRVPIVHPRDLPPCDVLKVDAEGIEAEVVEHYPHFAGVSLVLIEHHTVELREKIAKLAQGRGMERVR